MPAIVVDKSWISDNERESLTLQSNVLGYAQRASGATKMIQMVQKPLKLVHEFQKQSGITPSALTLGLEGKLSTGVAALNIPRLPGVTVDAKQAFVTMDDLEGMTLTRKIGRTISTIFDAISTYCYCIMFVKPIPIVGAVAQAVDLTSDLATLPMDYSDYQEASRLESEVTGPVKDAFAHSRKYYMLCVAKDVAAIAGAVLGLLLLPIMPVIGLISLSLAGTILAISKDLLKASGPYPVIPFDRGVRLA